MPLAAARPRPRSRDALFGATARTVGETRLTQEIHCEQRFPGGVGAGRTLRRHAPCHGCVEGDLAEHGVHQVAAEPVTAPAGQISVTVGGTAEPLSFRSRVVTVPFEQHPLSSAGDRTGCSPLRLALTRGFAGRAGRPLAAAGRPARRGRTTPLAAGRPGLELRLLDTPEQVLFRRLSVFVVSIRPRRGGRG
jgi:hypothetical protein